MHDEPLERRLRAALSTEAGRLPLTITAAELERRAALRGRGAGNRRLTLLLAAAVAIGALGVGGLLSGAIHLGPTATTPITAVTSTSPTVAPSPAGPVTLPTLDELMASTVGTGPVLVAQAHDSIDTRAELLRQPEGAVSGVGFPFVYTAGTLTLSIVCLGGSTLEYDVRTVPGSSPGRTMTCDGTETTDTFDGDEPGSLVLFFREPVRWRVVLRGPAVALPLPTMNPALPPAEKGLEELVRMDDQTSDSSMLWGDTLLALQETRAVPGRFDYHARIWCEPGDDLRLIFGDYLENGPELTADTETYVRCNGLPMDLDLRMVHPDGSRVFVATTPSSRWSLLITGEKPPVGLVDDMPSWTLSTGFGPSYAFEQHGVSFSNTGVEGGGPLRVELECAGPEQTFQVLVDLTEPLGDTGKTFLAECVPDGARTGVSFTTTDAYSVEFTVPAGGWVAATALIPEP